MADRVGQQLGNYRLLRLLGEGFAEVYLAEHLYLGTQAAIKVLHTRLAHDDLEGFLSETRTIAALKHPHIVCVLDFGVEGGTPFLVMDYAPGGTLRERLPKGAQLSPVALLPIVQQVADALESQLPVNVLQTSCPQYELLRALLHAWKLLTTGVYTLRCQNAGG